MSVRDVPLELIEDNPFNPRQNYPKDRIASMATSLQENGQREIPQGREVDGHVQLAQGGLRLRGLVKCWQKDPDTWKTMRIDVVEVPDDDMFFFAIVENLERHELTPLEVARAVNAFMDRCPDATESAVAKRFGFSQGYVGNMRRVLRLPEEVLKLVDEGKITFTQGRELLPLESLPDPLKAMKTAYGKLQTGGRTWGEPNTVAGIQKAVYEVVRDECRPLDKEYQGYRHDLIFDVAAAGCDKCQSVVSTRPTSKATARFCINIECWEKHQEDRRQELSAAAREKAQAEVLRKVVIAPTPEPAAPIPRGIPEPAEAEPSEEGPEELSQRVAAGPAPARAETFSQEKELSARAVGILANLPDDYPCKTCPKNADCDFSHVHVDGKKKYQCLKRDKPTEIPASTRAEVLVDAAMFEKVKASYSGDRISERDSSVRRPFTHEGKKYISTGGFGGSGISEDHCYQLVPVEEYPGETHTYSPPAGYEGDYYEDRRNDPLGFYHEMLVNKGTKVLVGPEITFRLAAEAAEAPAPEKPGEVPEEVLAQAREKAGTRAEVLSLADITTGSRWYPQFNQGYASLGQARPYVDDFEECTERCTQGFHYAFDPRDDVPESYMVCSNPDCLAKKKAARTKRVNAEGQGRRTQEKRAIKAAVAATTRLDHSRMKVIFQSQFQGYHVASYRSYPGGDGSKSVETWLWDKLSSGTPAADRSRGKLWKRIDQLSEEELARLVVEFCFYALTDHGATSDYKVQTEEQLRWLGVTLQEEPHGP